MINTISSLSDERSNIRTLIVIHDTNNFESQIKKIYDSYNIKFKTEEEAENENTCKCTYYSS